ncbi:hypothetical protein J0H58_25430 [bacterium]|nr:hypothetical protein [bacterium]
MPIPIDDPVAYTVPPSDGFVPDRLGVRRVVIDVDRATNAYRASFTPCPANAAAWGPQDAPDVSSFDLVAELLAAPDSADKVAALQAVQRVADDLLTVGGFLLSLHAQAEA